ncbi:YggT family protein [Legionella oakridgensis]|uniref:YggT family protein n=2 Tax=Legionella oakridgensis TaxID=29423 RepID=A0A0W0WX12_9GAMM|nr:YggT family protein [Legionella oakridgensis]AHE66423.1 putative integral membrane protein [Legionella oakridgensis ATCC 33761 = DSM 21215]KTD36862.1 YggT family protein [Legionella oakridgensis]STY19599.1 Integral membrane protein YggT, involved in response to extracytoplasmic stress (osmotic shock) [Legionella longbeachae]
MTGLANVGHFLFSLFFSLLTFFLWARIALRYLRVSALHPVSQAIFTLTNPIIAPLERLFPQKRPPRYDWAAFTILVILELIKFVLMGLIFLGIIMPITYLLAYTLADLIIQPCNLLFYAIVIRVVMSWVNPGWRHPAADFLYLITEPLFRIGRRIIPDISGFDFSPFIMMVILKVITLFISGLLPLRLI